MTFRPYQRKGVILARPYVPGEDLSGVSVSETDTPQEGGWVAQNPDNPEDMWYIDGEYFRKHYEIQQNVTWP